MKFLTSLNIFVFEHIYVHCRRIVTEVKVVAIFMLPYLVDILEAGKIVNSVHQTLLNYYNYNRRSAGTLSKDREELHKLL